LGVVGVRAQDLSKAEKGKSSGGRAVEVAALLMARAGTINYRRIGWCFEWVREVCRDYSMELMDEVELLECRRCCCWLYGALGGCASANSLYVGLEDIGLG
jgi:hypothetical protein